MALSEMLRGQQTERRFGVALTASDWPLWDLPLVRLAGWFSEVTEPQKSLQTVCAQNA